MSSVEVKVVDFEGNTVLSTTRQTIAFGLFMKFFDNKKNIVLSFNAMMNVTSSLSFFV